MADDVIVVEHQDKTGLLAAEVIEQGGDDRKPAAKFAASLLSMVWMAAIK